MTAKRRLHTKFEDPAKDFISLSQMPISEASRKFAVLMAHHYQTMCPVYFVSRSLPFGACSSVYAFNRISKGIWHLLSFGRKALGGVYFDDFTFLEPSSLCALASHSFEGLLGALGWTYTADPAKRHPFAETFDVLGARFNVGGLHGQTFSIENKPGRLVKIRSLVDEVKPHSKITKREAQVIHGNMNFAMSFVMGQTLKVPWSHSLAAPNTFWFWTHGALSVLAPRRIDPNGSTIPVLVFTDAAYEGESGIATWRVVIIDPLTGSLVAKWHDPSNHLSRSLCCLAWPCGLSKVYPFQKGPIFRR